MKVIGAYDKSNNNYVFPQNASKKIKYKCPDCEEDLIFKKGEINIPYFSHKSNSNCTYYDHPNESQIHKDAKNKLAQLLRDKKPLKIKTKCSSCNKQCKNKKIKYKENDTVVVEYTSMCKKYIADVAIINNDKVRYILEVTNTHKTIDNAAEVRPEPWFDINADEIMAIDFNNDKDELNCIRTDCSRFCNSCLEDNNLVEQAKDLFKKVYDEKEINFCWECILCNEYPLSGGEDILHDYNIIYDYKFKNINIDIAIFNKEEIKYFIIFNENIIDKIPAYIKWFYFEPDKFLEQYKDYINEEYFVPRCDKSNFGQYCMYSYCYSHEKKWFHYNIPKPNKSYGRPDEKGICLVCNQNKSFFLLTGTDNPIKVCNDCIFGNCRDKLIKYKNINNTMYHNQYFKCKIEICKNTKENGSEFCKNHNSGGIKCLKCGKDGLVTFQISDYCNSCRVCDHDYCNKNTESNNIYCIEHICKKDECYLKSERNSFCVNHKCIKNSCRLEKESNCDYCIEHKCKKDECCQEKEPNNNYCIKHICNKKKCNLVVESKYYCSRHQYCIIQNDAIKDNKKVCKNITNGCYEYINDDENICKKCKNIKDKNELSNITALDFI